MVSLEFAISSTIALLALLFSLRSLRQEKETIYDQKSSELLAKYSKSNNEIKRLIGEIETSITCIKLSCDVDRLSPIFRESAKRISLELELTKEKQSTNYTSLLIKLNSKKTKHWRKELAISDAHAEDNCNSIKNKLSGLNKFVKTLAN